MIRADYNIALDFLDSVALDLPAGMRIEHAIKYYIQELLQTLINYTV